MSRKLSDILERELAIDVMKEFLEKK